MKKYLLILLAAFILVGCGDNKPVETIVSKSDVDLTGNAFKSFRLGGDVHLLMAPNTENPSKWMILATVPIQKTDASPIDQMSADINLLDGNGIKVRDGFVLSADDLASVIPVFNASSDTEKTIVFSAGDGMKKDFDYKEAVALLQKVKKITLTINTVTNAAVEKEPEKAAENTTEETKTVTLNSLLTDYGIYGMLAQYDKYLKNGEKKKAKQVEDRMWEIEKKVQNDMSIPKYLRDRFVEYIENKEDEIERRY